MELPFHKVGIAHLACSLINIDSREEYLKVLDLIPDSEFTRLFTKAASLGVGIELNSGDMNFKDEEAERILRMFKIAKQCGCKFYLGSDAHTNDGFCGVTEIFEQAVELLNLTEDDKFVLEH